MVTTIVLGVLALTGVITFGTLWNNRQKTKERLALEAQRFEKLREILTDGVLTDKPAALEALKPIAEVIVAQMEGEKDLERLQMEHTLRMKELKAANEPRLKAIEASLEPLRWWERRIMSVSASAKTVGQFNSDLSGIVKHTRRLFPNLQLPAPDKKLLAEKNEDKK